MRILFLFISALFFSFSNSQNNLRLFTTDGRLFKVSMNEKTVNKSAQPEVRMEGITKDTLYLKVEFETGKPYGILIYLLEKGEKTSNKEFDYEIAPDNNKVKVRFSGMYDIIRLPNPIVPIKPVIDTSAKYKNKRLGHFCELKDGKPLYFNNLPKSGPCSKALPPEYLNYINILMSKAGVADERFTIAENVCRNNCLSVEQLNILVSYVDYEIEKLKLVKLAWPSLTDRENRKNLEKSFRFESSILELNNFFKDTAGQQVSPSGACSKASEQNKIDGFVKTLSVYANDAQRFDAFKKLYADHCYSVSQITVVLQKFIHDREKLDAAKLLYFYCTEKDKYESVSETFSYKTTAADLIEFVNKQKN